MGNFVYGDAIIRMVASSKSWIESDAVQQLEKTATLKGMRLAVGLPDLHPGKGCPVGAAFLARDWIYPFLIGNDIGCGMGLWRTELKAGKIKQEAWSRKLYLDGPWQGDRAAWLANYSLQEDLFPNALGTIGGGNHFAELQRVDHVVDPLACSALGLNEKWLYLLVHSGSRGLGESILRSHTQEFGNKGLQSESDEARDYLVAHDDAVNWAKANRALIAKRFLSALRSEGECLMDHAHNTVTPIIIDYQAHWLHRKGASPANQGALIIPGSRGSHSYLVKPIGDQWSNALSLAHGAGRKRPRSAMKAQLSPRYRAQDLHKTSLGSSVICEDKALLFEEAPQAYKNIDQVIQTMVDAQLIRVLAVMRPVLTYKKRRQS